MANWGDYLNIWWNDADLALALAYLLVDDTSASACRAIMDRLGELRRTEVTEARGKAWNGAGLTALTAVSLTGPVGIGIGLVTMGISGIVASSLRNAEPMRWRHRCEACDRLQRHFPRLRGLFA